jgi:sodium transport system permease protein
MNFRHVIVVLKKEIKDITRDKKTLLTSILIPMILIPLIYTIVGSGAKQMQQGIVENINISISKSSDNASTRQFVKDVIKNSKNIFLQDESFTENDVRNDKTRLVVEIEKDVQSKLKNNLPVDIKLKYDNSKPKSGGAIDIVSAAFDNYNKKIIEQRIIAKHLNPQILTPTVVEKVDVEDKSKSGGSILAMLLPMLIGIMMASGGIGPAVDLIAGEKERNTFEPLLTTKSSRSSLLLGKYLTINLFSMLSLISILIGLIISYRINPDSLTMGSGQTVSNFGIEPLALILTILVTLALGMTFTGIQIALSTYAKSFKEAQTYLSLLMIATILPSYATMFMQPSDVPTFMFALPLLNTFAALKMVLGGIVNYSNLLLALGSSIVFVIIAFLFAARLFNKEKVLFRS